MSILTLGNNSVLLDGTNCYQLIAFCHAVGGKFDAGANTVSIKLSDTVTITASLHSTTNSGDYSYYWWGCYDTSSDTWIKVLSNY